MKSYINEIFVTEFFLTKYRLSFLGNDNHHLDNNRMIFLNQRIQRHFNYNFCKKGTVVNGSLTY